MYRNITVTLGTIIVAFVINKLLSEKTKEKVVKKIRENIERIDKLKNVLVLGPVCGLMILAPLLYFLTSDIFNMTIGLDKPCAQMLWPLLSVLILMGWYSICGFIAKKMVPDIINAYGKKMVGCGLFTIIIVGIIFWRMDKNIYYLSLSVSAIVVCLGFFVSIDQILGIKSNSDSTENRAEKRKADRKRRGKIDNRMMKIAISYLLAGFFVVVTHRFPVIYQIYDRVLCVLLGIALYTYGKLLYRLQKDKKHIDQSDERSTK